MVEKIGRNRVHKALPGSIRRHFADPQFRQRTIKKALGRVKPN